MNQKKRRILLFRPNLGDGGADRVTLTLLQQLDRRVFEPRLVLVRHVGPLVDQIPKDIPVITLNTGRLRFSSLKLASILRRERPDVLLSTSSGGNLIASIAHIASPDAGRRLILSERNTFSVARRERRSGWLPVKTVTRLLYRKASRIIAVSNGVAEDLREALDLPPGLVKPIYNPVVDEQLLRMSYEPTHHPWFEAGTPIILAVGRLVAQKDYPVLLRAFKEVRRKFDARLIILGEGPDRSAIEALVDRLGIAADVNLPGYVKNPFPYMRRCSVYVMSSRFEGLPGALIQAMACGAPVVSTDCPSGPSEIVDPGKSGFLVEVGNVNEMAEAIGKLLGDVSLRHTFSEAATIASTRFSVKSMIHSYEEELLDTASFLPSNQANGVAASMARGF